MLGWKVILELVCVVIAAVLVFWFVVPYLMGAIGPLLPYLFFEIEEDVRCHLFQRLGICLSLYPNPVKEGEKVQVAFRTRRWYEDEQACVADNTNKSPKVPSLNATKFSNVLVVTSNPDIIMNKIPM